MNKPTLDDFGAGVSDEIVNPGQGGKPSLSSFGVDTASMASATQKEVRPKITAFDRTVGGLLYGGSSSLESLSKLASSASNAITGSKLGFDGIARSLEAFKKSNPEYAPEQADSFLNLLTSPGKLISHVMAGAPQFLGTAALIGTTGGWVGIPLAAAINGGIDGQNIYDDAKSRGVAEDDAQRAAVLGGTIAAVTQIIPEAQLFKYSAGGRAAVAKLAYAQASAGVEAQAARIGTTLTEEDIKKEALKAISKVMQKEISPAIAEEMVRSGERNALNLSNLTLAPSKTIADQTVGRILPQGATDFTAQALSLGGWSAAGGAAEEGIKRLNYGSADPDKALPDFSWGKFLDERAQEFLTGAATSALGIIPHQLGKFKASRGYDAPDFSSLQPDMVSKEQFYALVEPHLTPEQIPVWRTLGDHIFDRYADANGLTNADAAVGHMVSIAKRAANPDDMLLAQTPQGIAKFFDAVESHVNSPDFERHFQKKAVPASQVLKWLEQPKSGLKADNLKWTGMRDALTNLGEQKLTVEDMQNLEGVNYETMVKQRYSSKETDELKRQYNDLKAKKKELLSLTQDDILKNIDVNDRAQSELVAKLLQEHRDNVSDVTKRKVELAKEIIRLRPKNKEAIDAPGLKKNFTEIVIHQPEGARIDLVRDAEKGVQLSQALYDKAHADVESVYDKLLYAEGEERTALMAQHEELSTKKFEAADALRKANRDLVNSKTPTGYVDSQHYPEVPHYLLDLTLASGHVKLADGSSAPTRAILELQSNRAQEYAKLLGRFVREQKYAKDPELQNLKEQYLSRSMEPMRPIDIEGDYSSAAKADAEIYNKKLSELKPNDNPDLSLKVRQLHNQIMRVHGQEFQMKGMTRRQEILDKIQAKVGESKFSEKFSDLTAPQGLDESRVKLLSGPLMAEAKLWVSHALKQAALDAVEGGFNHLSLPDPEQVADRWHDRGESEWDGMHYFYSEVVPNIAEKLFRQYDPNHKGSVEAELVGGKTKPTKFDPNATGLRPWTETQKLRTLEITPAVKERVILGQPLYQREDFHQFMSRMKEQYPNRAIKAVMDKTGHLYTGDVEDHGQLLNTLARTDFMKPEHFTATGVLAPARGNRPAMFVGSEGGMVFYTSSFGTNNHVVEIKDPSRQITVVQPRDYLAQAKNGSIEFQRQADSLQRAFFTFNPSTNFSTPLHEMAHLLTVFSSPEQRQKMSEFVGREFGHWGTAEYEKIATSFEDYLKAGRAPVASLQGTFDSASDFFAQVYGNFRKSSLNRHFAPSAREVFDNWFFKDSPEVKTQRELVDKAQAFVDGVAQLPQNGKYQGLIDRANRELEATDQELVRLQMSQRSRQSEVEVRQEWNVARQESLKLESSNETKARLGMNYLWLPGTLSQGYDFTKPMENVPAGRRARELAFGVNARTNQISAPEIYEVQETVKKQDTSAVAAELNATVDFPSGKGGAVKARQYFDRSDPNKQVLVKGSAIQKFFQLNYKVNGNAQQRAVDAGIFRRYSDDTLQPWRTSKVEESARYARIFDTEFYNRWNSDSKYRTAVVDCIMEMDPSLKPSDRESFESILDGHVNSPDIRRSAALEFGRTIKVMPDYVYVEGKKIPVLVMDYRQVLERTVISQARRTAFIEKFGQQLQTAEIAHWSNFAKTLGVSPPRDTAWLRDKLVNTKDDTGAPIISQAVADAMSFKQLARFAKDNNVLSAPGKDDYNNITSTVKAADLRNSNGEFDKNKVKRITQLAKTLGGITLDAPFPDLFEEVRSRLKETPVDVASELKKEYTKQGGDLTQWDTLLKQAQGIDAWRVQKGNWWKAFVPVRDALAMTKMMFNAPMYAVQHLNVLPLVGLVHYGNAVKQFFLSPETTRASLIAIGVLPEAGSLFQRDINLTSRSMKWLGEVVAKVTLQNRADYYTRSVIGLAAGSYAEALHGNVSKSDLPQLRNLRLSPDEVKILQEGKTDAKGNMPAELKAKIAQGIFDKAMAYSNPAIKKGYIDSHPLAKFFFAYGSYSVGMARYMTDFFGEIKAHFTDTVKGDLGSGFKLAQKAAYLLAAAGGSYLVTQAFSAVLNGNVSKDKDKNLLEKGTEALLDFGLLGPANRLLSAAKYDGGSPERIYSTMMPQLTAVVKLLGALVPNTVYDAAGIPPQSKYANYSYGERLWKTAKDQLPISKAIENWKVSLAFPESQLYDETVAAVDKYAKRSGKLRGKYQASSPAFENPATFPVYEKIRRFDVEGAQEEATRYYQSVEQDLQNPQNVLHGEATTFTEMQSKLRAALLSKAPLSLPEYENLTFLSESSLDQVNKYMKADAMYRAYVDAVAPESKKFKWKDSEKEGN